MFEFYSDEDIKKEAKEVARKTVESDDWEKYVEGAAFRIIKLERQVEVLTRNFWIIFFFIFVLPLFARMMGG